VKLLGAVVHGWVRRSGAAESCTRTVAHVPAVDDGISDGWNENDCDVLEDGVIVGDAPAFR
jgi:hypothetical protein